MLMLLKLSAAFHCVGKWHSFADWKWLAASVEPLLILGSLLSSATVLQTFTSSPSPTQLGLPQCCVLNPPISFCTQSICCYWFSIVTLHNHAVVCDNRIHGVWQPSQTDRLFSHLSPCTSDVSGGHRLQLNQTKTVRRTPLIAFARMHGVQHPCRFRISLPSGRK